jgi:hypothetical protein
MRFAANLAIGAVVKSHVLHWQLAGCRPACWALSTIACCLAACGEARLENAMRPALAMDAAGKGGASGVPEIPGGPASGGGLGIGGQTAQSGSGGTSRGGASQPDGLGLAGSDDAGGAAPLPQEPLVSLEDFSEAYIIGPVDSETFQVSDLPFTQAWRATMTEPPQNLWTAQLVLPLNKPVTAGSLLHVTFWVRCEKAGSGGDCKTAYVFERASAPWEKSVTFPVDADSSWTQKSEFFSVVNSYDAGVAHMVLRLGYATQTIAIGGIEVESIGAAP